MTIMKTIAMAALAGTLIAGPTAAFAQSTEHGDAGATHGQMGATTHGQAGATTHGQSGVAGQLGIDHKSTTAGQTDDQDEQGDQDTEDDTGGVTDGTNGDQTGDQDGSTSGGASGDVSGDVSGHVKANGKTTFGTIVSGIRTGSNLNQISDLSGDVTVVSGDPSTLSAYAKGNNMVAIENAVQDSQYQANLQATLTGNTDISTALTNAGIDASTVSYAYVDASGNLVVFTNP